MKYTLSITLAALAIGAAPAGPAAAFKACQVADVAGINDRGFNQTAWKGLEAARDGLGAEVKFLESSAAADYEPNINALLAEGCDIIITVGFQLRDATRKAAEANPETKFSIVDVVYDPAIPNVLGQVFAADAAAFLAGYLAAGLSKSGIVGTFGGVNIPPVTVFMDGLYHGVQYYNRQKGAGIAVLGWNPATREGLFTNNFESLEDGRTFAKNLVDEGADIVLPVAGPLGLRSAALADELGAERLRIIGVDADQALTDPERRHVYLTSVLKHIDSTVVEAIRRAEDGTFEGGVIVGTLASGGVGLAPFHDFEAEVPDRLKAELEAVRQGIIDGSIPVGG